MSNSGRHVYALACTKVDFAAIEFKRGISAEHEKILARGGVKVFGFARAWRHAFFDDAEISFVQQMPAVADFAPHVMLGVAWRGGFDACVHDGKAEWFS